MSRKSSRRTARRSRTRNHSLRSQSSLGRSLYHRKLRLEPLEDRRLLAVVTVTTLSDTVDFNDGVTSLREAIFAANTVPGADAIQFDPSLTAAAPATILLKSGLPQITDALAIDGPGADLLTIDGRNSGFYGAIYAAPFVFPYSTPSAFALEVSALTIANSNAAGITAFHVDLTVSESAIIGSQQGGIASGFGSLKVTSSRISGNSLTNSRVIPGQYAAGISAEYGDVSVVDTTISNNSSKNQGGGISLYFTSSASIVDCTIVGNSARFGGGIFTRADTPVSISGSTISNNTAVYHGGGLYAHRNPSVTITSSVLNGNYAGQNGGAVDSANAPLFITGSMITGNTAGRLGGGIFTFGPATIVATSVIGNSAGHDGGGINAYRVALDSSTISGNSAIGDGGGIWVGANFGSAIPRSTITRSTIAFNTAGSSGGGLFATVGTVVLDNSIVARNSAISGRDLTGLIGAGFQPHFSLIGSNAQSGLATSPTDMPDGNGNHIGPYFNPINPRLGPLVNNGGPALPDGSTPMTHALLPGSPAINTGDPAAVAGMNGVPQYDQRGTPWSRVSGGRIDIGAVEFQPNPLAGDYNFNGVVDADDYTVWRDTLGSTTDLRADATGTGGVNQLDYEAWKENFGATLAHGNATSISAPVSAAASSAMPKIQADSAAGPIVVTTLSDTVDFNDGVTSLREAIFAANTVLGADTIQFDPALTAVVLTQGELKITDDTTIVGPGAGLLAIDAVGNDLTPDVKNGDGSRVFDIEIGHSGKMLNASISGVTLTGGDLTAFNGVFTSGDGGAIRSYANLSIVDCIITGNGAGFRGGAIFAGGGHLSISGSAINDNIALSIGGGICAENADVSITASEVGDNVTRFNHAGGIRMTYGTLTVRDSAIQNNRAGNAGGGIQGVYCSITIVGSTINNNVSGASDSAFTVDGGGVYEFGGDLTIQGSTISNNSAKGSGGGVYFAGIGQLAISYSTIANNIASAGGGGIMGAGAVSHSVIAHNHGPLQAASDVAENSRFTFSLIGTNADSDLTEAPLSSPDANGNLIGGPIHGVIDPLLGPLADNGGFALPDGSHILTHALLPGSPAIHAGDLAAVAGQSGVPAFDERGTPFGRVFGGRIDMGAVEYQPAGFLAGDYNRDGIVDAADYTVWRDSRGNNVVVNGSGADGNRDGVVNDLDYGVWRTNFGATLPVAGGASASALQMKDVQPPASPGVSGATVLRVSSVVSEPPAEPGAAAVLATRQPLSVTARNELLFADWRALHRWRSPVLGDMKAHRPRGAAATDEVNGDRVSAVDSVFTALNAGF